MYYYSKNSSKKIIHINKCYHLNCVDYSVVGHFDTLSEAYSQGYRLCKHCNPLLKHYKAEMNAIINLSRVKGLSVYPGNKSISIFSIISRWKITLNDNNDLVLYHKNDFEKRKDSLSEINGYHLQSDIKKNSIIAYLNYIIRHDAYRRENPLTIYSKTPTPPPRKGTKRYKKTQRKIAYYERKQAIKNVLTLIDSLSTQPSTELAVAI